MSAGPSSDGLDNAGWFVDRASQRLPLMNRPQVGPRANCRFWHLVPNHSSNNLSVLLDNSDGTFQPQVAYGLGDQPMAGTLRDLNNDGFLDYVSANAGANDVSILLGNGDSTFAVATSFPVGSYPTEVAIGDFDGDGINDLEVVNSDYYSVAGTISVLLGNGDGSFQGPVT